MTLTEIKREFKKLGYREIKSQNEFGFVKECKEAPSGKVIYFDKVRKTVGCGSQLAGISCDIEPKELQLMYETAKCLKWIKECDK